MKKITFFFLICCFINNCFCQEKFNEVTLIEEYKRIDKEISHSTIRLVEKDSLYRDIHLHTIEYYDNNNNMIKRTRRNLCSILTIGGNQTECYKNNKVIVSLNQNIRGAIWRLVISKYNENGDIIETRQFDFNRIFKTIFNSSMQQIYFDSNGNQITDIKMANRDIHDYEIYR
jgi:hypothetical protein